MTGCNGAQVEFINTDLREEDDVRVLDETINPCGIRGGAVDAIRTAPSLDRPTDTGRSRDGHQ
jgi:hypothetical protein